MSDSNSNARQIQFNGTTYNVIESLTTQDMRDRRLFHAAEDFERRGIFETLTLVRPNGRNAHYDGYVNRAGQVFSVSRAIW